VATFASAFARTPVAVPAASLELETA
jgi:hypothetical protein